LANGSRPLDAVLINGPASHAPDYDDVNSSMDGHPSVPLLPALFASADSRKVDGRAFITAFVTGFETEARLGPVVHRWTAMRSARFHVGHS
jgi:2-methylcitrate dehydratase PrpD